MVALAYPAIVKGLAEGVRGEKEQSWKSQNPENPDSDNNPANAPTPLMVSLSNHEWAAPSQLRPYAFVPTAQWNGVDMKNVPSASACATARRHSAASSAFSVGRIPPCRNRSRSLSEKVLM